MRSRTVGWAVVSLVALLGAVLWWRADPARARPRNLLLLTLDTTRADRIGCYGGADAATPILDRLAARGVRYDQATTPSPLTLPAHVSLMTSSHPAEHGVHANGDYRFGGARPTLAEVLAGQQYRTAAFVSSFVLDRQFGLSRGFRVYDQPSAPAATGAAPAPAAALERSAALTTTKASAWLRAEGRTPFFLWVHYFDPHDPYEPPPPFAERFGDDPYAGEIAFMDAEIGRLLGVLEQLELAGDTLVVVVGDHGEGLGQHDEESHGVFLYESTLRVPLIMALPGELGEGEVVRAPVSTIDVAPTVLDLLGVTPPPGLGGRSLRDDSDPTAEIFSETRYPLLSYGYSPLRALRRGPWKYIDGPAPELYHLEDDPDETQNRVERDAAIAAELRAQLRQRAADMAAASPPPDVPAGDAAAELMSLGYLAGGAVAETAGGTADRNRPDPKSRVSVIRQVEEGMRRLRVGEHAEAAWIFEDVTAMDADNFGAWLALGQTRLRLGQVAEGREALEQALRLRSDSRPVLEALAEATFALGDFDASIGHSRSLLAAWPGEASAHQRLGMALGKQGAWEAARPHFARVIELAPDNAQAYLLLASAEAVLGRPQAVGPLVEQAANLVPDPDRIRNFLPQLLRQAEAERAARQRPTSSE